MSISSDSPRTDNPPDNPEPVQVPWHLPLPEWDSDDHSALELALRVARTITRHPRTENGHGLPAPVAPRQGRT